MPGKNRIEIILSAVDRGMNRGLARAKLRINEVTSSLGRMVPFLLAAGSGAAGLNKLIGVAREFSVLNAGLITATGSAEKASLAFAALEEFAKNTPYDLQQVTSGFIQLVNYGLDPSERALTSYGNTSAALGKDLSQMIEAVADAATGEFERLKEFGIKARTEGDNVRFTFRGVTTTVKKNAAEIEQYLIGLGEENFGSAMVNRMAEIDGELSNLGDSWDGLFRTISNKGVGNLISIAVRAGISAIDELTARIDSGEIGARLQLMVDQFAGWANDIDISVRYVTDTFFGGMDNMSRWAGETVDDIIDNWRRWPESIRAMVGLVTVYVASTLDKVKVATKSTFDAIKALVTDDTLSDVAERNARQQKIIEQAREAQIDAILDEYQASVKSAEGQRQAISKLREEYDAQREARKASYQGVLASAKISGETAEKSAAAIKKETQEREKAAKAAAKLAAEKLRAASQEKIISLELEQLEASKLPTAVQRAEAELAIQRRLTGEKVDLKRQQLEALKNLDGVDPAEIIRAESELAEMRLDVARTELEGQREIARERLAVIEDSWRLSEESIAEYRQRVSEAYKLGLIETKKYNEQMIASGTSLAEGLRQGMRNAMEEIRTDAEIMIQLGEQIPDRIASGLTDVFQGALKSADAAKQAVADWARSTLSWIAQVILKQTILNAIQSSGFGFGDGGQAPIVALAGGGSVPGWSPSPKADNIRAWLTAREFVHPVDAVDYYGLPFMEAVRRKLFPKNLAKALAGNTVPRIPRSSHLASGGQPASEQTSTELRAGDTRLKVVNVVDRNMLGDYLRTSAGETTIFNFLRKNGSTVNTILGR